jgi:hypothetical protein
MGSLLPGRTHGFLSMLIVSLVVMMPMAWVVGLIMRNAEKGSNVEESQAKDE